MRANSSALLLVDHVVVAAPQVSCTSVCWGGFNSTCARTGAWTFFTPLSLNDSSVLGNNGSLALRINGASASIARTSLRGADGHREVCAVSTFGVGFRGLDGGHGLEVANGASLRLAGGTPIAVQGGNGANGDGPVSFSCCGGGGGGNGLIAAVFTSALLAPGLQILPGAAGVSGCLPNPIPGAATVGSITCTATALPSLNVSTAAASPGGTVSFTVNGEPGFLYAVAMANAPMFLPVPGVGGPLFLEPASLTVFATGVLGASGSAAWTASVPPDPSLSTFVGFLQLGVMNPASSALDLSPAAVLVVL